MKSVDTEERWFLGRDGLHVIEDLTWEQWTRVGYHIRQHRESASWALADWLVYGIDRFKPKMEQFKEMARLTGYSLTYLNNLHSIGRAFPQGERWLEVALATHREVMRLEDPVSRQQMLRRVQQEKLSVIEVRNLIDKQPEGVIRKPGERARPRYNLERYTHVECPACGHQFPAKPHRVEATKESVSV